MLATAAKLALVTAALALVVSSANAQRIHPRCTKSSDKVKCTCWVENGAEMVPSVTGKGVRIQLRSEADMDRIIACMRRNGRPNG
jgi:hypothetical protein